MKKGFTLAEVLITIGIVGVIAAITIPALIKHYEKHVTVTRIKKFYSNMNQAIMLSEVENGSCTQWETNFSNNVTTNSKMFFDKYLMKYLKSVESSGTMKYGDSTFNILKFNDGSAVLYVNFIVNPVISLHFYPVANRIGNPRYGKDGFAFVYSANKNKCSVEPFTANLVGNQYKWNGTRQDLISNSRYGCRKGGYSAMFCAKLIQFDGWKIEKDYPW